MLAKNLDQWERETLEQGIEQGIEQEKQNKHGGQLALLGSLLEKRFGPLPDWARKKLDQADVRTLERWALQLLNAESLEAVFK